MRLIQTRLFCGALLFTIVIMSYHKWTRKGASEKGVTETSYNNISIPASKDTLRSTFDDAMVKQFGEIYEHGLWGFMNGEAMSGGGSTPDYTQEYRRFLESFFTAHNITSVLDVACGLWTFSHLINWGPVNNYIGIDIVPEILKKNQERYGNLPLRPQFVFMSMLHPNLPAADLLIAKDVMQHLPLNVCKEFLTAAFSKQEDGKCKYKHMLITNERDASKPPNQDHPLFTDGTFFTNTRDLRLVPFSLSADDVFTFGSTQAHATSKVTQHYDMERSGCDRDFSPKNS